MWAPLSKLLAVPSTHRFPTKCFQLRFGRIWRRHSNGATSYFPFSIAIATNYLLWKNPFRNPTNMFWSLIIRWIEIGSVVICFHTQTQFGKKKWKVSKCVEKEVEKSEWPAISHAGVCFGGIKWHVGNSWFWSTEFAPVNKLQGLQHDCAQRV